MMLNLNCRDQVSENALISEHRAPVSIPTIDTSDTGCYLYLNDCSVCY